MPYYSDGTIENVRAASDIVDVISTYVKLEKKGGRYFGLCPFHTEKTGSFCVSPQTQLFHCFGCHEGGNVISFVMKYESLSFPEAVESLAERAGITIESERGGDPQKSKSLREKRDRLYAVNKAAAQYYYYKLREAEGERGLSYFTERGLTKQSLNSFGLGYTGPGSNEATKHLREAGFSGEELVEAGISVFDEKRGFRDRFFNRVMFPIMDVNRRVIAFGARVMGDGEPKYLNSSESPIFNKSQTLYGLHVARRTKRREFILCEGYMDVISANQGGFDNVVATLGTAITPGHAVVISRYAKPITICYDTDGPGRKAARKAYEVLSAAGIGCKIMDLKPCKDPDEMIQSMGAEEFEKRINRAENAFIKILKWDYEELDTTDPDAVTGFTHHLTKSIAAFPDEAKRSNYIKTAAREFALDEDMLRRMVNSLGNAGIIKTYESKPASGNRKRGIINQDDALRSAEAALLYFLLEPAFFEATKTVVEEEDFREDIFRALYRDIKEKGRGLNVADFISRIEDENISKYVSRLVVETQDKERDHDEMERIKRSTLLRVKKASLKRRTEDLDPGDSAGLQKALEITNEVLEEIENIKL